MLVEKHPSERVYVAYDNSRTHQGGGRRMVCGAARRLILLYLPSADVQPAAESQDSGGVMLARAPELGAPQREDRDQRDDHPDHESQGHESEAGGAGTASRVAVFVRHTPPAGRGYQCALPYSAVNGG